MKRTIFLAAMLVAGCGEPKAEPGPTDPESLKQAEDDWKKAAEAESGKH